MKDNKERRREKGEGELKRINTRLKMKKTEILKNTQHTRIKRPTWLNCQREQRENRLYSFIKRDTKGRRSKASTWTESVNTAKLRM